MAKKKKGARKAASRGTRKAASKTTRRAAARPAATARTPHISSTLKGEVTWAARPGEVNLTPLKAILTAHINRLRKETEPTDQVLSTLKVLEEAKSALGSICGDTMVIPPKG